MEKQQVKHLSWILRGKQRRNIIKHINGPDTPTQIAKKSGYSLNHTSKILNDFKKQGLVKLLNPKEKTGRLYTLTEKGRIIKDKVKV